MFHQREVVSPTPIEGPDCARSFEHANSTGSELARLLWILRNNKKLIAGTTLISLLAATAFMLLATPRYTAVTQILIDPTELKAVENGLTPSNQLSDLAVLQVESQVRVLTSDNVLRRVVSAERLDTDPTFTKGATWPWRSWLDAIARLVGIPARTGKTDPTLAALYELQRAIRVKRAERTYVVDVSVTTDNAEKSVGIANALTDAYLAEQAAARFEAARRVSESLSARLSQLKDRVRQAEERVEQFKSRHNIIGASGQLVNEQQLSDLNNQLSLASARTAETKSRFEQLQALQRSGADLGAFTEAVQSQTLAALRAQYADVLRREAEQTTSLGERHPSVIEIRAQAQRLRRVIADEVRRISEAARSEYERARASEESLAGTLDMLKRNTMLTNEARVGLRELERDVQASRAVYEAFLVRSRETGEQERLDTKNVRVISKADVPIRRSWPPSFAVIALGAAIFGICAGTGLAFLRDFRGARDITTPGAHDPFNAIPVIAAVPEIGLGDQAVRKDPASAVAIAMQPLLELLGTKRRRGTGQSVLLITARQETQASAVAFNLALIAAATQRVLLIGTDLPVGPPDGCTSQSRSGLIDVASGKKNLAEVIIRDPASGLHMLPLFGEAAGSYREVRNDDIKAAFEQIRTFDLVLILASMNGANPVAPFFAGLAGDIVLITGEDTTRAPGTDALFSILGTEARKIRGRVLTQVSVKA